MSSNVTNRSLPTLTIAAIVFAGLGFLVGRISAPSTTRNLAEATPADSNPATPSAVPHVLIAADSVASNKEEPALNSRAWSEGRWRDLNAARATPARNRALAEMLEQLAARDPHRALALAQAEGNLVFRESLVQAAVRGWATAAPADAADWAHALTEPGQRERALASVFGGAVAGGPAAAVEVARSLIAQFPAEAVSVGGQMVDALCDAGAFEAAASAASTADLSAQPFLLGDAYAKWAAYQPDDAMRSASSLADPAARIAALRGVTGGWSAAQPVALLQAVETLPAGDEKNSMLSLALQRWARTNPGAASEWLNTKEGGAEFDSGVASVATLDALKPDIAASWAESVVDRKLRSETLVSVLRSWATKDLAAAKSYFTTTQNILPEDRQEIAALISTLSGAAGP